MYPIFLNKYLEAFDGPIEGIKYDSTKCTQLCGSVPSITAMNKDINTLPKIIGYLECPIQNKENKIVPIGISQS